MFYPNGYMNMDQSGEYTKHYYADALRIASKIGSGFSQNLCDEANQIGDDIDPNYLEDRRDKQYDEMMEELTELINGNQITDINPIPYPEANLCNLSGSGIETALFFYHPDHLGSTGMVTNNSSNITQGMLYAPFGEIICDYNPTFHDSPMPNYAFNAKELDEENNMYYYSARYYAPPTFISRDPLFERNPWMSPYAYCSNQPINKTDPSGMYEKESQAQKAQEKAVKKIDKIYGSGAGQERVGPVTYNSETKEYGFTVYTHNKESEKEKGAITPVLSFVTNKKESRSAIDVAKYSTLKGEAKYAQGILMNARNSSGLESLSYYLKYLGTQTITEENFMDAVKPAIEISGQVMANSLPFSWVGNVTSGFISGKDIWGNEMNTLDWISLSIFPASKIPGINNIFKYGGRDAIPIMLDMGNGAYKEFKK